MQCTISRTSLRRIAEPFYRALGDDTIVRIDVYSDSLRFRANGKSRTFYLDQSIPVECQALKGQTECGTYWVDIKKFWDFQSLAKTDDITIRFQDDAEKPDIEVYNAGLNLRLAGTTGDLMEYPSADTKAEFFISHSDFKRAVSGASAVGDELRICVHPGHVKFLTNLEDGNDGHRNQKNTFRYIRTPNCIRISDNDPVEFSVSTRILEDFVGHIYPSERPRLEIAKDYLLYHAKHPTDEAKMGYYIAERANKIPE